MAPPIERSWFSQRCDQDLGYFLSVTPFRVDRIATADATRVKDRFSAALSGTIHGSASTAIARAVRHVPGAIARAVSDAVTTAHAAFIFGG